MRLTFKAFDSKMASREKLFKAAVEYINKLPRENIQNITHSEDRDNIVITVWFWTDEPESKGKVAAGQYGTAKPAPAGSSTDGNRGMEKRPLTIGDSQQLDRLTGLPDAEAPTQTEAPTEVVDGKDH